MNKSRTNKHHTIKHSKHHNKSRKKTYKKRTYKKRTYKKRTYKKRTYKKKFVSLIGSIPEKKQSNKVYVVTNNVLTGSIIPGLRDYKM
jgi:alpha-galactosidase/6-phospho-beta-glucosidase family protein